MTEDADEEHPDRRKHGYASLEKKLDGHVIEITTRLERFFAKAIIAFAVLGLTSTAGLFGFGIVLVKQHNTAVDIQTQRYDSLIKSCKDQNQKYTNVVSAIDNTIAAIPEGPKRDKAEKGAVPFKLIIGAAVPYTDDCKAYADSRVKGAH